MHNQMNTKNIASFNQIDTNMLIKTFRKEDGKWHICPDEHPENNKHKTYFEKVAGTDEFLYVLARKKKKITISMDTEPFENADVLKLDELCDAPMGGGYYVMHTYRGKEINKRMWLCDIVLFLFGDMPQQIYVRRIK